MVDIGTLTAALGAASAGIQLIDKISDQVTRFITGHPDPEVPKTHRSTIERDGQSLVRRYRGIEYQRITAADLEKLPEADLRHIRVHEQSMENLYLVWMGVYPQLALALDPIAKVKAEIQLRSIVSAMKTDLVAILNFLEDAGLELDDHYRQVRDVVSSI